MSLQSRSTRSNSSSSSYDYDAEYTLNKAEWLMSRVSHPDHVKTIIFVFPWETSQIYWWDFTQITLADLQFYFTAKFPFLGNDDIIVTLKMTHPRRRNLSKLPKHKTLHQIGLPEFPLIYLHVKYHD